MNRNHPIYTNRKSAAEVAAYCRVDEPALTNAPEEVYPGAPGVVMRKEDGRRVLQSMTWGFPLRLKTMRPDSKPKPVNNIADLRKSMWSGLARKPQWRCIIPLTAFAEAEGEKGAKTRTWFSLKNQPVFGTAGLWRVSDEWGPVYSMVMTDANDAVRPVHDRMPVLLRANEHDAWLDGSYDDAIAFQDRQFPSELIDVERTDKPWSARKLESS